MKYTCKPITLEDVFACTLDISKKNYKLLIEIGKHKEITVKELAKKLKKDRTTIQKLLKELMRKKLVVRRQLNLRKGGYIYYYSLRDKDGLKSLMRRLFSEWCRSGELLIDKW